jgi:hypothetical protein
LTAFDKIFRLLPQLVVTFIGVFSAFLLDRLIDRRKRKQDKKTLFVNLFNELNFVKSKLIKNEPLPFPDIWESAISSGQLRLLSSTQVMLITHVYRWLKETVEEQERHKDLGERFEIQKDTRTVVSKVFSKELVFNYERYCTRQNGRRKQLLEDIERLLERKWWKQALDK